MPLYQAKPGVLLQPRTPELVILCAALQAACDTFGYAFTITSGRDGTHSGPNDPHPRGRALDIRTQGLTPTTILRLYAFLQGYLGPQFYLQYEIGAPLPTDDPLQAIAVVNPGVAPHLHVQLRKGLDQFRWPCWPVPTLDVLRVDTATETSATPATSEVPATAGPGGGLAPDGGSA